MDQHAAPAVDKVSPPTVTWPDRGVLPHDVAMTCPNCGATGAKTVLLTVNFATPGHRLRHSRVLCCAACSCHFYENQSPPDYTAAAMLGRGRVAFYVQQGAGLSLITRPLARLARPPGSIYLEIGCGFGFGLDFAIRARGWRGLGIDPGQIAAVGAALLGVSIEQRYLRADEPQWTGRCDVVMASETIEHVPSPRDFVAILRHALRPDGVLILTTPDGGRLREGTDQGVLVPLLSPGLHLVFQTDASLRRLLVEAGFGYVVLETDGTSLVAFASDAPFDLEADDAILRGVYGDHLERRAGDVPRGGDLYFGFAGRALQEAVNDGDGARAQRVAADLADACRDRFGIDIATIADLPEEARCCSLERLAELMPLNLGGILYADAVRRLAAGAARATLSNRFVLAADAADAMRRALGELAMEDGMSESISRVARAEALLCDAAAGRRAAAAGLLRLADHPGGREIVERGFVEAVNAGHLDLARDIASGACLQELGDDATSAAAPARRNTLFCLAVLDVQHDAAAIPERGARRFAAVMEVHDAPDLAEASARGLFQALDRVWDTTMAVSVLPAFRRLAGRPGAAEDLGTLADELTRRVFIDRVNAGDYRLAREFRDPIAALLQATGPVMSDAERDAAFCLGVLDLQPDGDPSRGRLLLGSVRRSLQPDMGMSEISSLFWAALQGETEAIGRIENAEVATAHFRGVLADIAAEAIPDEVQTRVSAPMPDEARGVVRAASLMGHERLP